MNFTNNTLTVLDEPYLDIVAAIYCSVMILLCCCGCHYIIKCGHPVVPGI